MPLLTCPGCHDSLNVESLQEIPAWCSKCGGDLPRDAAAFFNDASAKHSQGADAPDIAMNSAYQELPLPREIISFEEAFSERQPTEQQSLSATDEPTDDVALQVQQILESAGLSDAALPTSTSTTTTHAIDSDDRFSKHNLRVGLLLAFWGVGAGLFLNAGGGSGHESIDSTADFLQMMMVCSGIALFVSGLGIRAGEKWGYHLAHACAGFQILCGLFFIVTWQQLRAASVEVEEAVAVSTFVRVNLDLLIGLVDGAGLALFLYGVRSKQHSERSQQRQRQRFTSMFPEQA